MGSSRPDEFGTRLHAKLLKLGFSRLHSDASLYVYRRDTVRLMVPVFIDDITIASNSPAESDRIVQELSEAFKLRDLGPTSFLLGIEITRDRPNRCITLSQRQYVIDMLERYGFSSCSPVKTPMVPRVKLSSTDSPSTAGDKAFMAKVPYLARLVLSCTWLHVPGLTSHMLCRCSLDSTRILAKRTGRRSSICSGTSRALWICG